MELMSGLDVNGHSSPVCDTFTSQEGRCIPDVTGRDNHCGSDSYPSPSSTVSPGHSPVHEADPPTLPISRSSELAFALQTNDGQVVYLFILFLKYSNIHLDSSSQTSTTPSDVHYQKPSDSPPTDTAPRGFVENVPQYVYGEVPHHPESSIYTLPAANGASNPSLCLPSMDYTEKYRYDGDTLPYTTTGHIQSLPVYPSQASAHYAVETNFTTGEGQQFTSFGPPPSEVYPAYNADPCNNPSSMEHPLEVIAQYS
jgi:hypothetical protein